MLSAEQPIFLLWIVASVAIAWTAPRRWLCPVLVATCALFLACYAPWSLATLAVITAITGMAIHQERKQPWLIPVAIALCLGSLVVYRIFTSANDQTQDLVILGMAFYVLRATHLLFESFAGRCGVVRWQELIAWLWFLPSLQVGPIHRFAPFHRELVRRRWDSSLFATGLQRILFGYTKIIVIGNYFISTKMAHEIVSLPAESWWYHYADSIYYGIHLYIKFSGYSDIAIGFALLLGFRICENFHFPFLATDIRDFWRRWHISLSSWCRDYGYLPVFSYTRAPAIAALASMLALGAWHELSWRYLLWGAFHGLGIAVCQGWQKTGLSRYLNSQWQAKIWLLCANFITLNFVIFSFTITGTESLAASVERWRIIFWITP